MNILWLSWRDIKHPEAGGAEVFGHEVRKRLARKGHQLTLFCPAFKGAAAFESDNGITTVRKGNKFSVYRKAKKYCHLNQSKYDLILDEINVRPFLNPGEFRKTPMIALIHQTIRDEWFYELPYPINYLFYYFIEKRWLKPYRNTLTITVSESSRSDLRSLGFKNIVIVPEGISTSTLVSPNEKEPNITLIFIGRLKKHKLPHHAIKAFLILKKRFPESKLWIIGDGPMRHELEKMVFGCEGIKFFGKIENDLKYYLLSRAHLLLMPSVREGWGLVVTESNAMGTPVVGYNVPGLRDSITHGVTGWLTRVNNPENMADLSAELLENKTLLEKFSIGALESSRKYSWDITTESFERIIEGHVLFPPMRNIKHDGPG